jgi:hypothetical protein
MKYNIYAGLSGGFGGATYQGTEDFDNIDEATDVAYQIACEEYDAHAGSYGLRSWGDIAVEEDLDEEDDELEIDEIYTEEREDWIEYYAVLTEEDDELEESEIVLL